MKEKKININGLRELLLVGVVLLLCVVWTVMNPQFLSVNNITNILRQASYTAIAAVGMTMIIIIGEIDLSAGSLNFEMDCITASVVGGTSMSGGRGKVMGTIVGVLLLTVLTNGMTLVGMNTYWQQVLKGVIIVVSVLADTRGKAK